MAKGKRKGRCRKFDASSSDESNEEASEATSSTSKGLDYVQRRELQRKAASEKRRAKMKCHLCGQTGHVRRECPGIADGGSGASKFTNSKGDSGAAYLRNKGGRQERGRKLSQKRRMGEALFPDLPQGFSPSESCSENDNNEFIPTNEPFQFYDASCDIMATIDYLRTGRGKKKLSNDEATALYHRTIETVRESSNYGGFISRSFLRPGRPWVQPEVLINRNDAWFVVGLGRDFLYNDTENESALTCLIETVSGNKSVVGIFADLDFSPEVLERPGFDRESQVRRLNCSLEAASSAGVSIQIRALACGSSSANTSSSENGSSADADVMKDLTELLSDAISADPLLKVHLSCWSGGADQMNSFLQEFGNNVWIGFDASVSFAKATSLHECAFDIPMSKVLLETGAATIPSFVARFMGRDAFSQSGLIPFVADAFAGYKKGASDDVTAEHVARMAAENTLKLYPRLSISPVSDSTKE